MQNLTHAPEVTEGMATEAITQACRANEKREVRKGSVGGSWCKVSFTLLADGTHEAALRNADGIVIALANVDEFDI